MFRFLLNLVALVAVMLMPATMASATAVTAAQPAAAAGHCGDHEEPADEPAPMQAHCAACSALPARVGVEPVEGLPPDAPRVIARTHSISGIVLEIATPPPKLA